MQVFCLLFTLTVCAANFSPPLVNISLDRAPEIRWLPLKDLYSKDFLQKAAAQVIDSTVPAWVHHAIKPVVRALERFTPQPYAAEIRGMAALYGADISDILLLNFAYEVSAFCTSIVAQDTKGTIYHGRNLDYPHEVLKNLTIDIQFIKNGEVIYRGTSFAGYVGLWTGQSKNKFTVTGNQRDAGHWWYNVISAVLLKNSPVSWLVRETLEEASDFLNAVTQLSNIPIISSVYYIVGGVYPGEGVVITRDRSGPADIWPLDTLNGNWYRVETNFDHWLPTPRPDPRIEVAMNALNATGQNNINLQSLYQILSVVPVCARTTVYTTVMSAAAPEKYRTVVREKLTSAYKEKLWGVGLLREVNSIKHMTKRWYRQYVGRVEMKRRYTWNIFQSIEYAGEQDQIKLYNFLGYLMDNFTPSSNERKLISHIFRENEICRDVEWERYFSYTNIDVPEVYSGPRLTFPLDANQAADLVEAFRNKQQLHSRYVLQLLLETWRLLRVLPNINRISTCHSKEITICGDLHGQLDDLLLIFYKNGMPSPEKPYVFNGDFVDRGKDSVEILLILFTFLLVYPGEVHLNRGNHEDHIINLRYGFTKEVLSKYKMHGKRILKLLQKIFSWLPLVTVIDQKVLVVHGGISDSTDLALVARLARHRYVSALRPPKQKSRRSIRPLGSEMDDELMTSKHSIMKRQASLTYFRPLPSRENFQCRSLQDFSTTVARTMEEKLKIQHRQTRLTQPGSSMSYRHFNESTSESATEPINIPGNISNEWKEILDLLWSDPMTKDGCIPNGVRGGGCYWGPNVTEDFLNKHNMQLIIRSHECKQDGYEFCHNRKVLTIFSASNYYEVGSNKGALVRLGPDLVPHFIQYQTNSKTREMSFRQSIRRTEHSALKVLREQLFAHKSDLIRTFQEYDAKNTGLISLNDWSSAVEQVLHLELPWRMLRSQLLTNTTNNMLDYHNWFSNLAITEPSCQYIEQRLLEALYRHRSTLETIFRMVDTDNSGFISFEDFCQTWKLLSAYLTMEISSEAINDLVVSIDMNKDGFIDIDEFMESFRLVDKNIRRPEEQE